MHHGEMRTGFFSHHASALVLLTHPRRGGPRSMISSCELSPRRHLGQDGVHCRKIYPRAPRDTGDLPEKAETKVRWVQRVIPTIYASAVPRHVLRGCPRSTSKLPLFACFILHAFHPPFPTSWFLFCALLPSAARFKRRGIRRACYMLCRAG